MKNVVRKTPPAAIANVFLSVAVALSPVLLLEMANADLLDSLKKAAEQVVLEELENAAGDAQQDPSSSSTGDLTPTTNSPGGLTPTASYEQPSDEVANSAPGLQIPDRWSTIENGIVVPHPVMVDGRVLSANAIEHYGLWMGLADREAATAALAEYLQLALIGAEPEFIETEPLRFALYLEKSERDRYLCPTRPMTSQEIVAASTGKKSATCTSTVGELVWAGGNELEIQRSRESFIKDYRDRLVAAAPKLPIEVLDTGDAIVSEYDTTKQGFMITSPEYSAGAIFVTKGPHHQPVPIPDERSTSGQSQVRSTRGVTLYIQSQPKVIGDPNSVGTSAINAYWPMESGDAAALVNRLWAPTGTHPKCAPGVRRSASWTIRCMKMTPEQKIFVRLHRTLTDLNSGTGYPLQIRGKMTFTSAVAYEDPTLERELHRLDVTGEAPVPKDVQTTGSVDGSDTALAPATIEAHDIVSHTQPDTRSEESNGQVQASGDAVSQGAGYAHALIQVTFSNGTSLPLEVVWLNPQGQEQPYFVLQPGASYVQTSYATHVWRFKHEGRVLGTYTIGPQAMQKWTIE